MYCRCYRFALIGRISRNTQLIGLRIWMQRINAFTSIIRLDEYRFTFDGSSDGRRHIPDHLAPADFESPCNIELIKQVQTGQPTTKGDLAAAAILNAFVQRTTDTGGEEKGQGW